MTSNSDLNPHSSQQPGELPPIADPTHCHSQSVSHTMQRDRFELLSAYLDGEVTANERRLVEEWLTTDAQTQRLHQRLLMLRSQLQAMPVPASSQPAEQVATAVFERVERRPKLVLVVGGTAIAAAAIASLSGIFSGPSLTPQLARSGDETFENLQIALNEPIVEMINPNEVGITLNEPIIEIPVPGETR